MALIRSAVNLQCLLAGLAVGVSPSLPTFDEIKMMPRHPRVHAEGLRYHVMARGNDGPKYESVKQSLN